MLRIVFENDSRRYRLQHLCQGDILFDHLLLGVLCDPKFPSFNFPTNLPKNLLSITASHSELA